MKVLKSLTILMYHSIADNPRDPHAIHPEIFAEQMEKLVTEGPPFVDLSSVVTSTGILHLKRNAIALTFDDAYLDFIENAVPILHRFKLPATLFAPTGLLRGTSLWDTYDRSKGLMNWNELAEVQKNGFGIGIQTVTHPRLTPCDEEKLEHELRGSLNALRERLPNVVPVLSYPGGYYGKREMDAAKRAGYIAAVGVASRRNNYPWTNRYRLRRRRWGE